MQHSPLAPSSAHRWGSPFGCPGWVQMNLAHPETETSEAAREGIAAHEIAEQMARLQQKSPGLPPRTGIVGALSKSGVAYTDDMYDAAADYAQFVGEMMRDFRIFGGSTLQIESTMPILDIHEICFGTLDFWLYSEDARELFLVDFKYGFGVVEAFENWQLMTYLSGVLDHLRNEALKTDRMKISLCVVQPRAFHRDGPVRTWETNIVEVSPYLESLKTNAGVAMTSSARTTSGPHCRDCSALSVCPAAQRAAMAAIDCIDQVRLDSLEPASLSQELKVLKRASKAVEYRQSAIEERITAVINGGDQVPGFELSNKRSRRKWILSPDEIVTMGDACGVDIRKPSAVLTPKQAIRAGLDEKLVDNLSEKPLADAKLTEINHNKAREVFA